MCGDCRIRLTVTLIGAAQQISVGINRDVLRPNTMDAFPPRRHERRPSPKTASLYFVTT
jgi:hypothetical protein